MEGSEDAQSKAPALDDEQQQRTLWVSGIPPNHKGHSVLVKVFKQFGEVLTGTFGHNLVHDEEEGAGSFRSFHQAGDSFRNGGHTNKANWAFVTFTTLSAVEKIMENARNEGTTLELPDATGLPRALHCEAFDAECLTSDTSESYETAWRRHCDKVVAASRAAVNGWPTAEEYCAHGISAAGMKWFLDTYGKGGTFDGVTIPEIDEDMTTADVNREIVLPLTVCKGWTFKATLPKGEKRHYKHTYVNSETDDEKDTAPAGEWGRKGKLGTRSLLEKLKETEMVKDAAVRCVRALCTWDEATGATADHLHFTAGQEFELVSESVPGAGWYTGTINGTEGIFPSKCVHVIEVPFIATPNVFFSHAWQYPFRRVVEAMQAFQDRQPIDPTTKKPLELYFWYDCFSMNEHAQEAPLPAEFWSGSFRDAISFIGLTCMMLSPWDRPTTLTRGWCLWELLCTVDVGVQFDVCMGETDRIEFRKRLLDDKIHTSGQMHTSDALVHAFESIDMEHAQGRPEDLKMIKTAARSVAGGLNFLNEQAVEKMRERLVEIAMETVRHERDHENIKGKLASNQARHIGLTVAHLLVGLDQDWTINEAWKLQKEVVDAMIDDVGEDHISTVTPQADLIEMEFKLEMANLERESKRKLANRNRSATPRIHSSAYPALENLISQLEDLKDRLDKLQEANVQRCSVEEQFAAPRAGQQLDNSSPDEDIVRAAEPARRTAEAAAAGAGGESSRSAPAPEAEAANMEDSEDARSEAQATELQRDMYAGHTAVHNTAAEEFQHIWCHVRQCLARVLSNTAAKVEGQVHLFKQAILEEGHVHQKLQEKYDKSDPTNPVLLRHRSSMAQTMRAQANQHSSSYSSDFQENLESALCLFITIYRGFKQRKGSHADDGEVHLDAHRLEASHHIANTMREIAERETHEQADLSSHYDETDLTPNFDHSVDGVVDNDSNPQIPKLYGVKGSESSRFLQLINFLVDAKERLDEVKKNDGKVYGHKTHRFMEAKHDLGRLEGAVDNLLKNAHHTNSRRLKRSLLNSETFSGLANKIRNLEAELQRQKKVLPQFKELHQLYSATGVSDDSRRRWEERFAASIRDLQEDYRMTEDEIRAMNNQYGQDEYQFMLDWEDTHDNTLMKQQIEEKINFQKQLRNVATLHDSIVAVVDKACGERFYAAACPERTDEPPTEGWEPSVHGSPEGVPTFRRSPASERTPEQIRHKRAELEKLSLVDLKQRATKESVDAGLLHKAADSNAVIELILANILAKHPHDIVVKGFARLTVRPECRFEVRGDTYSSMDGHRGRYKIQWIESLKSWSLRRPSKHDRGFAGWFGKWDGEEIPAGFVEMLRDIGRAQREKQQIDEMIAGLNCKARLAELAKLNQFGRDCAALTHELNTLDEKYPAKKREQLDDVKADLLYDYGLDEDDYEALTNSNLEPRESKEICKVRNKLRARCRMEHQQKIGNGELPCCIIS
eukprot:COSAG02_NODE_84_length_39615_cov_144.775256_16_plen_1467_part_00